MSRAAADLERLPPPPPETFRSRATYWRYRSVWGVVAALPTPVAERLPDRLGPVWHAAASDAQRAQVRGLLRRVTGIAPGDGSLDDLTVRAYTEYARYWVDAFRLHRTSADRITSRTATEGVEQIDAALARGGAILATGHLGSWDLAARWCTLRGWPVTVVAEVVEPRRLFHRFVDLRRRAGLGVVPLVRGGDMIERLVEEVQGGALATLLADRDLTGKGPIVDLFGEPCRQPPGVAALARRTGVPVFVGAVFADGPGRYRAVIEGGPLDLTDVSVTEGTQMVSDRMAQLIRRFPTQWHVFVRQWLVERDPDHPAVAAWRADPDGWSASDAPWRGPAASTGD